MKKTTLLLAACMLSIATLRASLSEVEPVSKTKADSAISNANTMNDAVVMDAMNEFKSLSRVERKMRISDAKKAWRDYKAQKASGGEASTNTILLVILALILPPLAVYLHEGAVNGKFWLSLLLTLLFWIPGVIYALIVVL